MKLVYSICFLFFVYSCANETTSDAKSIEIWEYSLDGKLKAISNFKKENNKNHYRSDKGFIFSETYTLAELAQVLSKLKLAINPSNGNTPIILLATQNEQEKIMKVLNQDSIRKQLPFDLEFVWGLNPDDSYESKNKKGVHYGLYALRKARHPSQIINGFDIKEASKTITDTKVTVSVEFTAEGGEKLSEMTKNNLNKFIAISIDNKIVMAPLVYSVITGGMLEVSGNFDLDQASELTNIINRFRRNGEWRSFHPNGKLKETRQYENGEQTGKSIRYNLKGKKI